MGKARVVSISKEESIMSPDDILAIPDVCQILDVKPSWCYNDHSLPWIKVGKYKRLYRKDLWAFLDARREAAITAIMRRKSNENAPNQGIETEIFD